jgi:hypothetical protein
MTRGNKLKKYKEKLNWTMKLSIIGLLLVVLVAPMSFAFAQWLNDENPENELPGGVYRTFESAEDFTNDRQIFTTVAKYYEMIVFDYNGTSGIQNGIDYLAYGETNVALMEDTGIGTSACDKYYFQLNVSAQELYENAVCAFDLTIHIDGVNLNASAFTDIASGSYSTSTAWGATLGLRYNDGAETRITYSMDTEFIQVNNDTVVCRITIDSSSIIQAALATSGISESVQSFVIGVGLPIGIDYNDDVLEFTVTAYSSDVSPYTVMDYTAMGLGIVFIIGGVFATPFVNMNGIKNPLKKIKLRRR